MMPDQRKRKLFSVREELIRKSREAALAAVQVFNNPNITFKSEIFIVMMVIAWTYLLHAYYRSQGIEYRHYRQVGSKRKFIRTSRGAHKHWELEQCLDNAACPLAQEVKLNLKFLIGLRHEIEHQMTTRIDDLLSARFQACCLNYNEAIRGLFGDKYGIDQHLAFSLQFSALQDEQIEQLSARKDLPKNIATFVEGFDGSLTDDEFNDSKYSYRVIFVPKLVNKKGQADKVIEFISPDSDEAQKLNVTYAAIKETEKEKFKPGTIVKMMKEMGYPKFRMTQHTNLWQEYDARNPGKGYGVWVEKQWFWYKRWIDVVEKHCRESAGRYS
ncbi:DUF3644 domain-containing protein [Geobacter sulfurreducens]|uniref:DUF3644 domain-containing protein n=1 Tax=Geobacter sulfurreducens TaxID=35554 RepID=UPI00257422D8|nr:DUF3644 domain-containing protein [Geobacter sulfurreducens]